MGTQLCHRHHPCQVACPIKGLPHTTSASSRQLAELASHRNLLLCLYSQLLVEGNLVRLLARERRLAEFFYWASNCYRVQGGGNRCVLPLCVSSDRFQAPKHVGLSIPKGGRHHTKLHARDNQHRSEQDFSRV